VRSERSTDERPVSEGGSARPLVGGALPMLAGDRSGFTARHGLWGEREWAAAAQLRRVVDEHGIDLVRVSFADQHGVLHGKTVTREGLAAALAGSLAVPSSLLLKDTSGATVYPVFSPGAGVGREWMGGAGDVRLIPDPSTFRILPYSERTGWVLCDLHSADGEPVPFCTRGILRRQLATLAQRDLGLSIGVELEFHVFRRPDRALGDGAVGVPGRPGDAPTVTPVSRGSQLLSEEGLDELDDLVRALHDGLIALDLPLRSIELEFGPNQLEVTLAPRPALQAADDVILCRAAIRQICRRGGYHATFMSRPRGAETASTGWHLHQSLTAADSGENVFASTAPDSVLSQTALHYLAGLLAHAPAASVFATPTVNGYKRFRPLSLAPDRIVWGIDNRGAMVRAVTDSDPRAVRLENRAGEPAANPYLFIASQLISGCDGIDRELDPGPPTREPYTVDAPRLPTSLMQALDALARDDLFASQIGRDVVDWLVTLKRAEIDRYLSAVSEWEQREYFSLL
jgi:glutamine synthetase